jgi:hypothetical protein
MLLGLFERKGKYIWIPFMDPEDIKILSLGVKGYQIMGHKRPVFTAQVHWEPNVYHSINPISPKNLMISDFILEFMYGIGD